MTAKMQPSGRMRLKASISALVQREPAAAGEQRHLKALQALGAEIEIAAGYVKAMAPKGGLVGGKIRFPFVSVGATENALMAAVLARGTTVIENAAREPEITDLCQCLIAMGAEIEGLKSDTLTVHGKDRLHGATHAVMPDRIEAGSYACAAMITGGTLELAGAREDQMHAILSGLADAGGLIDSARIDQDHRQWRDQAAFDLDRAVPAFPTDMQAQFMSMLALAEGTSLLTETIFENRYMHVPELTRMGADIEVRGRSAVVRGVYGLVGAPVMATDLRASMSLVLAGLAAEGETEVNRVYHLDRGYERLEEKLRRSAPTSNGSARADHAWSRRPSGVVIRFARIAAASASAWPSADASVGRPCPTGSRISADRRGRR